MSAPQARHEERQAERLLCRGRKKGREREKVGRGREGGAGRGGGGAEQSTQREDTPASQPPSRAAGPEEEWWGWRKPPEQFAFGALGRVSGAPPGSSMSEVKAPRGFQQVGLLG